MSEDIPTIGKLQDLFNNVVADILGLVAIVLFIVLLSAGFKFITSGGDPKALEGAKKTITYAIGGMFLILISYLILVFIKVITGVDVTTFRIGQ